MPDGDDIPYVKVIKRLTDIDDIRAVPVIGGLYGAANTVIDYFESDCNPDWHVYAETLFPAVGKAVLVLVSFGLDDVLRGYFRPAGGRGFGGLGRASRRTRKLSRASKARGLLAGGIPETGELIGKHLPGAEIVRARPIGNAERFLWKIDGLAQRGLWWWMIADVLDDFTINWTTALYRSEECRGVDVGGFELYEGIQIAVGPSPFQGIGLGTTVDDWGNAPHTAGSMSVPAGMIGFVAYSGWFYTEAIPPGIQRLILLDSITGVILAESGPPLPNPETGQMTLAISAHLHPGQTVVWGASNTGGNAFRMESTVIGFVRSA